jgi:mannose-6-phosphate isomerase-like protein (cupin superfamily)
MTRKPGPGPVSLTRVGRITPDDSKYIRGRVEIKKPGEETGAHVTEGKEEVIIVLEGTATVHLGGAKVKVGPGQSFFIGEGVLHNVRNDGRKRLRYVYVRSLAGNEHHHRQDH